MKELFDITKIIFERQAEWPTVTNGEKKKFFFALNRRFAIQYPLQAQALQHLKIDQVGVIDFWFNFLSQQYKRTPSWMYTKGVKKAKESKERKQTVNDKTINEYVRQHKIDKKSVIDALEFFPKDMGKELKKFEKVITQK